MILRFFLVLFFNSGQYLSLFGRLCTGLLLLLLAVFNSSGGYWFEELVLDPLCLDDVSSKRPRLRDLIAALISHSDDRCLLGWRHRCLILPCHKSILS
jgi:hypothetical protein